jgi:hypothetical protein
MGIHASFYRQALMFAAVSFSLSVAASAWAYAPESDLLKIKGYSPEVIQTADTQRSRQEWREPSAPKLSPVARFFHNIYNGNWTGDVDEFGSTVIRDN